MTSTGGVHPSNGGHIRSASALDESELVRLVGGAGPHRVAPPHATDVRPLLQHGHLLVLDLGNGRLGGAVHLDLDGEHAMIDLLVADAELASAALEHRLSGVAQAYCEALGRAHVDASSAPQAALRHRGRSFASSGATLDPCARPAGSERGTYGSDDELAASLTGAGCPAA